jgi:hypothetical protein
LVSRPSSTLKLKVHNLQITKRRMKNQSMLFDEVNQSIDPMPMMKVGGR